MRLKHKYAYRIRDIILKFIIKAASEHKGAVGEIFTECINYIQNVSDGNIK